MVSVTEGCSDPAQCCLLSPAQPPQLPLSASYAAGSMKGLMCAGPPDPNAVLVAAQQYSPPQPAIAASL